MRVALTAPSEDRALRIAWLGPAPGEGGGVPGVAADLLHGLAALGHTIDCFCAISSYRPPARLAGQGRLEFVLGTSGWGWDRWYSRTRMTAFTSGLLARALASVRLRRELARRHAKAPYDAIYQFSNIENLAVPRRVARRVPLVVHPETHMAGELRFLLAERHLSRRCGQPRSALAGVAAIMAMRALVQRLRIRRARQLICISGVFRDQLVRDYGFPRQRTVVVPNPTRLERFAHVNGRLSRPAAPERSVSDDGEAPAREATVLVLGRIAARKGVEDVVALAKLLRQRDAGVRVRVVGGPSLWSDYTRLLEELPAGTAEYAGQVPAAQVPAELARCDLLLQPSHYEPFALTVAEALAAGVPVVASAQVGAIEQVDRSVAAAVRAGDVEGYASAILAMLARLREAPEHTDAVARAEAARLFAPEVVCRRISRALEGLVEPTARAAPARAGRCAAGSSRRSTATSWRRTDSRSPPSL